jgi:hypothetical protein
MAISARLARKTQLALLRYCKAHGVTKTEALERSIALLIRHDGEGAPHHPAFSSFERLREQLCAPNTDARAHTAHDRKLGTSETLKRHLDEKYSA